LQLLSSYQKWIFLDLIVTPFLVNKNSPEIFEVKCPKDHCLAKMASQFSRKNVLSIVKNNTVLLFNQGCPNDILL